MVDTLNELETGEGTMRVPTPDGDTKLKWNRGNASEVAQARATFNRYKGEGFAAYASRKDRVMGGEVITVFDPDAERITFIPPMVGG